MDTFWDKEELEQSLAAALYWAENKTIDIVSKQADPAIRVPSDMVRSTILKQGMFFPAKGRWTSTELDIRNDPLKPAGSYTALSERATVGHSGFKRIARLPIGVTPTAKGAHYIMYMWCLGENVNAYGLKWYVTVTDDGKVWPCNTYSHQKEKVLPYDKILEGAFPSGLNGVSDMFPLVNTLENDKKHTWLLETGENDVPIVFGVTAEEVKSLLYARDLPLTATGRKRPILHWVTAHKRRLKSGTEVDIDKMLRGIDSFRMHGLDFQITQPVKKKAGI